MKLQHPDLHSPSPVHSLPVFFNLVGGKDDVTVVLMGVGVHVGGDGVDDNIAVGM